MAVGSLLWCTVATRPDISYALSVLSKHTRAPREALWKAVKRVSRYLKATKNHGILYTKAPEIELLCHSDADWAGDQRSRMSTSGMATFCGSGLVSYKAQQSPLNYGSRIHFSHNCGQGPNLDSTVHGRARRPLRRETKAALR